MNIKEREVQFRMHFNRFSVGVPHIREFILLLRTFYPICNSTELSMLQNLLQSEKRSLDEMFYSFMKTLLYFGLKYTGFPEAYCISDENLEKVYTLKTFDRRLKNRLSKNDPSFGPYIKGEITPKTVVDSIMNPETSKG